MTKFLFPSNLVEVVGSKEAFEGVIKRFYELSFEDPILGCLYVDKTEPHHLRFAAWFYSACGVDDSYRRMGGTRHVNRMHKKSQHCPLRGEAPKEAGYVGDGFTVQQRNRWLRLQLQACEEFNLPKEEFVKPYIKGLSKFMVVYGPFSEARTDEVDSAATKCPVDREEILKGSGGGGSSAPHPSGNRSSSGAAATAAGKGEKPFAAEVALAERELALIGMIQSKSFKNSKDRKDAMRIHEVRQAASYLKEGKRKEASKTLSDAKKKYSHMVEALKAKQADAIKKANEAAAAAASVSSSSDDVVDTAMEEMPRQSKRARLPREERESSSSPEPPTKRKKSAAEATGSTSSESEPHEEGRDEGKIPSGVLGSPPNDLPPMEFSLEWIQHFFTMMSSKIPYHPSHDVLLPTKVKTVEQTQEQRVIVDGLSQHELLLILRFIERLETNIRVQVAETRKLAAAAAASGKKNQGLSQKALAHIQVPHKFRLLHSMGDPSTSGLL
ncbi:hypothetical protein FOZ60_001079, partial [Perkinsus olseni]